MRFIVCGCGPSIKNVHPERYTLSYTTIGVNDAARHVGLDYHVVIDPLHHFDATRATIIENTPSRCLFTQLPPGKMHTKADSVQDIQFFSGGRGYFGVTPMLSKSHHSTFVAACLAIRLGATAIAFAGMDLVNHPNFDDKKLRACRKHLEDLCHDASSRGIKLFNLGRDNILTGIPNIGSQFAWERYMS